MTIKTKLNTLFLCFGILFLVSSCETKMATPQSVGLSEDSLKIATQRLHNYVDDGKLPGTFVRIIKEGKVVYNDRYGLIDIAKNKPVEDESFIPNFFNDQACHCGSYNDTSRSRKVEFGRQSLQIYS